MFVVMRVLFRALAFFLLSSFPWQHYQVQSSTCTPDLNITVGYVGVPSNTTTVRFQWTSSATATSPPGANSSLLECQPTASTELQVLTVNTSSSSALNVSHYFLPYSEYYCDLILNLSDVMECAYGSITFTTPESIPGKPADVRFEFVESSYNLTITWDPPLSPNGVITIYNIYVMFPANETAVVRMVGGESTSYTLKGLEPYQEVRVWVSANTSVGEGAKSDTINTTTDEAIPGPVSSLVVSPLNGSTLVLCWARPNKPNGIILGYRIQWSFAGTVGYDCYKNSTAPVCQIITDLEAYKQYTVSVEGQTSVGYGEKMTEYIYTKDKVLEVFPQNLNTKRVGSTLTITWDPIPQEQLSTTGVFMGYNVTIEPLLDSSTSLMSTTLLTPVNATDITVDALDPNVAYKVSVSGCNSAGAGPSTSDIAIVNITPSVHYNEEHYTQVVQIRLSGVENCNSWKENETTTFRRSEEVKREVVFHINQFCPDIQCSQFSVDRISDVVFLCTGNDDKIIVHAQMKDEVQKLSVSVYRYFEYWISTPNAFMRISGQALPIDSTCPPYVESIGSGACHDGNLCSATVAGTAVGSFAVGVLLTATVLIVVVWMHYRGQRRKMKQVLAPSYDNKEDAVCMQMHHSTEQDIIEAEELYEDVDTLEFQKSLKGNEESYRGRVDSARYEIMDMSATTTKGAKQTTTGTSKLVTANTALPKANKAARVNIATQKANIAPPKTNKAAPKAKANIVPTNVHVPSSSDDKPSETKLSQPALGSAGKTRKDQGQMASSLVQQPASGGGGYQVHAQGPEEKKTVHFDDPIKRALKRSASGKKVPMLPTTTAQAPKGSTGGKQLGKGVLFSKIDNHDYENTTYR